MKRVFGKILAALKELISAPGSAEFEAWKKEVEELARQRKNRRFLTRGPM